MSDVLPRTGVFVRSTRVEKNSSESTMRTLYPGDTIEYGITHEVELPDRTKMWLKVHSSTTVQADETSADTADRLVTFVHTQMQDRLIQAVQDAGDLRI